MSSSVPAQEALASATSALAAAGCDTPRLDAELLLAHALGVRRERLFTDAGLCVQASAVHTLQEGVRRRAMGREPLAYITGRRAFRHLQLAVDARALIPRPETELLVEAALKLPAGTRVLDVGTGCGAVALALAHERPDLIVHGSDRSLAALALAGENSRRLKLPVRWLHADLLRGLPGDYDAVLANLPYVATGERPTLAPEITRHEPHEALFAGGEGLDAIAALASQLAQRPSVRMVALEVGMRQAPRVAQMLAAAGFARVRTEPDLAGIDRAVVGEGRCG